MLRIRIRLVAVDVRQRSVPKLPGRICCVEVVVVVVAKLCDSLPVINCSGGFFESRLRQ